MSQLTVPLSKSNCQTQDKMKLFSVILPTLLAALATAQNDMGLDQATSQKICMGAHNFDRIQKCAAWAETKMPSKEETEEAVSHVEEGFNMWDFVRGYANDKVLVFECLGWLSDCGAHINVSKIK